MKILDKYQDRFTCLSYAVKLLQNNVEWSLNIMKTIAKITQKFDVKIPRYFPVLFLWKSIVATLEIKRNKAVQ